MKILLVESLAIVRQGLRQLVERVPGALVREAATLAEAEAVLATWPADLVVLDMNQADGDALACVHRLAARPLPPRIVAFSMHSDPERVRAAFAAGAVAYVTKTIRPEDLLAAIASARRGEAYIDPTITTRAAEGAVAPRSIGLSRRETEIFELLGRGRSMTEIAASLGVAYKTVANTSLRLREKLGVKSNADLVRLAIQSERKGGA